MVEAVVLIVALAALCCMATNMVLVFSAFRKKKEEAKQELTADELEQERKQMEALQRAQKGFEEMMAYTGLPVRKGGSE